MKLSEHKALKTAIVHLPEKEKDKLLLRLVAKDKVLTEHLHYKLLETESDLEDRKEAIKYQVSAQINEFKKLNAKEATVKVRKLLGLVNHFYKVTKDSFSEVELRLFVFKSIPLNYKNPVYAYRDYAFLFATYIIKAVKSTLIKLGKLHEDLQFDLSSDANKTLEKIYASDLAVTAKVHQLPQSFN